jgi:lipoate-protein ligase A
MTAPAGSWRLIREEVRSGPMQMALDAVAAATAAEGGPWTLRVYSWDPSTLSLGYHQDPATVDWDFCDRAGIDVVRRPTGGGAIYHDRYGDISYSVVAPRDALPGDLTETYELLCEPLFDALDRVGVEAGFADARADAIHEPACYLRGIDPVHDVVAADGRKLSGNAQYRTRDAVIQHGSLTYERRVDRHLDCFTADLGAEPFRERVTSVRDQGAVPREAVVSALESAFRDWAGAESGEWTDDELDRAGDRVADRFGTAEWTRREP